VNEQSEEPGHLPVLDGVRGLAIVMVLLIHFVAHMVPTNGIERAIVIVTNSGELGVTLFFVLSGFLIRTRAAARFTEESAHTSLYRNPLSLVAGARRPTFHGKRSGRRLPWEAIPQPANA